MLTLNLKFHYASAEEQSMDKLNLRRLKLWKTLQNIASVMLILQVIHEGLIPSPDWDGLGPESV